MIAWQKKLGIAVGAMALVIGAIPGTVGVASAYENPNGGQHFDRGRFPRTIHIVILLSVATVVAILVASKSKKEAPTSP
jgi:hypothetical protein